MATQPDDELELTPDMEVQEGQDQDDQGDDSDGGEEGDDEATSVGFADEEPEEAPPKTAPSARCGRNCAKPSAPSPKLRKPALPSRSRSAKSRRWPTAASTRTSSRPSSRSGRSARPLPTSKPPSRTRTTRRSTKRGSRILTAFEQKKGRLEFEDRDEAISSVQSSLDLVQQAVIVKAAADPALFLYALSKSEAKRDELAKIHDPIKMAAAVARMEGAVKVTKGRKAPDPDRPARGSASMPGGTDKQLEKLEKEADRTGDRTKLIAYKKKLEGGK
jgi:hypothetical protein